MRLFYSAFLSGMLLSTSAVANMDKNKDDNRSRTESGWRFGDKQLAPLDLEEKKKQKDLLSELVKIAKEQLKVQKKMLKIMQEQFDPEPKEITLKDGTKCIANSSAKCFEMPLEPVAKRIPVLGKWVSDPTKENAKEWLKWQAKYFNEVFKSGNAARFAIAKWGDEAYPTNFKRAGFESTEGIATRVLNSAKKNYLNSLGDKIELFIFFGKSFSLDIMSYNSYSYLLKQIPNIKATLVFNSSKTEETFLEMTHLNTEINHDILQAKRVIKPSLFSKFGIKATPSFGVFIKETKSFEQIGTGRASATKNIQLILDALEYNGVISHTYMVDYKAWADSDVASEYYQRYYKTDINTTRAKLKYEGQ